MTQFSDLKLDPKVLQAITDAGYTTPTPIQAGAIPPALEGRDVLGIAQTGTGKTASFTLPMITLLGRGRARARMPRSLVLCPTRELAAQVAENFDTYAKHTRLTKALLIGGVSMKDQERLIDRGVDVLIATPGRLLDHFERGNLLLQGVQIMVVDEADRMLDMGFIPDIERIFQLTPFTRQTLFFSATMAPEIERITDTFLHSPERIEVARQATTSETITQKLIEITPTRKDQSAKQKRELLRAIIIAEGEGLKNAIIFCNRKTEVDIVAKSLKAHGFDAAPIHGDLEQAQRMRTLDGFREGTLRFLVASDVAARGLDIPAVSHVFNFDLPSHAEDYVHRIGRTGRAGRQGTAISLGVPADEKYLAAIENLVKASLPRAPVPEGFSISDAAREAPRAPREERSARSGRNASGHGRGPRGKDEHIERSAGTAPLEVATIEPTPPRIPAPEHNPAPEHIPAPEVSPAAPEVRRTERRNDRRDEPRTDTREDRREPRREESRRDEPRSERRDESRRDEPRRDEPRREDRRGNGRDERRGGIVGLGDHVPDFMNRSFRTSPAPDMAATEAVRSRPAPVEVEVEAEASAGREQKRDERRDEKRGGRSRRGRGRNRGDDRAALIEADAGTDSATPEAVIPEALVAPEAGLPDAALALETVALPEVAIEPVSTPVLDEHASAAPVVLDPDPQAVAPRRVRIRKPKVVAKDDVAPKDDNAPKAKAPRKAKAVPQGDVVPAAPLAASSMAAPAAEAAGDTPAPEPASTKPKRVRKPKAVAETADPAADTQAAPAKPARARKPRAKATTDDSHPDASPIRDAGSDS